jgi:hypothetical protein
MRKNFFILCALGLLSIGSRLEFTASAGGPVFWRINTRAEVERGDAQGISIADNGSLTLAPAFAEVFDTKQAYIWSAASDASGSIYLGTGHEGRIFKVDPAGKGALLYKAPELSVMALAVDGRGNLYAGTSPDGKVYRITPAGEAKVFFEPKAKYIWSLAFDRQGRLLVGTGDKGVIYRVNQDGAGAPLVVTTQTNITSLLVDGAGQVLAGTDPGGLILRISPEGRVFTLLDTPQREVHDLALGSRGEIYALVLAESAGGGATNTAPAVSPSAPTTLSADEGVTITISDVQVADASGASMSSLPASASAGGGVKSAIYRLDPKGAALPIWESREAVAFSLAFEAGRVLLGTGQKGRVYSVGQDQKPLLLAQSTEGQTSSFIRAGNQLYATSSNLGKLFRIGEATNASGIYLSPVRDALGVATWGRLSWVGEGELELQTRTGNTATPDSTWSDWSAPIRGLDGGAIQSPTARFLQYRATLRKSAAAAAPRLREVTISYLPQNLAPRISSVTILPAGVALQAMPQAQIDGGAEQAGLDASALGPVVNMPPRRVFQRGAISLQWTAEDRNGDTIEYTISYREAAGGDYYPLKNELRETYFTVEPNALPDGRYVFKIVATDAPSNPSDQALIDDQETEPVEIDNTPPTVSAGAPARSGEVVTVTFKATDATSVIRRAEYQLDGRPWLPVFPVDGIADAREEEFRVSVTLPDARAHVIGFRAFDATANIGGARVAVKSR